MKILNSLILSLGLIFYFTSFNAYSADKAASGINYGAMLNLGDNVTTSQKIELAKNLGIKYIRVAAHIQDLDDKQIEYLNKFKLEGFKVVLNILNKTKATMKEPAKPATNISLYKQQVKMLLDSFRPDLIIVENEEIADNFYTGTMSQYLAQLNAVIEVAKPYGIAVTDGGITTLKFLTYLNYIKTNQTAKASSYASRTGITPVQQLNMNRMASGKAQDSRINESLDLIESLKASKVSYVNFHWYGEDPEALAESIDYLRTATGKPVITTEIGQYEVSVSWIKGILNKINDLKLPYVIWYSGETDPAVSLFNDDLSMRQTGAYYKNFLN